MSTARIHKHKYYTMIQTIIYESTRVTNEWKDLSLPDLGKSWAPWQRHSREEHFAGLQIEPTWSHKYHGDCFGSRAHWRCRTIRLDVCVHMHNTIIVVETYFWSRLLNLRVSIQKMSVSNRVITISVIPKQNAKDSTRVNAYVLVHKSHIKFILTEYFISSSACIICCSPAWSHHCLPV